MLCVVCVSQSNSFRKSLTKIYKFSLQICVAASLKFSFKFDLKSKANLTQKGKNLSRIYIIEIAKIVERKI